MSRGKGKKSKKQRKPKSKALSRDDMRNLAKGLDDVAPLEDVVERLIDGLPDSPNMGADMAWLVAYDLDQAVSHRMMALFLIFSQDEELADIFMEPLAETAVPVLDDALRSPNVPDDRKLSFGPLLYMLTGEEPDESYEACFRDFEGTLQRSQQAAVASLSPAPRGVYETLYSIYASREDSDDDVEDVVYHLVNSGVTCLEQRPAMAAALLSTGVVMAACAGQDVADFDELINSLGAMSDCPEALWLMDEMARWPMMDGLNSLARQHAGRMKMRGLTPAFPVASEFSHGMVTGLDGVGSRNVILFFKAPEDDGLDAVVLMPNDLVGLKDAFVVLDRGEDVESDIYTGLTTTPIGPCSIELAREIVADALARNIDSGRPVPWGFFALRPYLGEEPIIPELRKPDLSAYISADTPRTRDLVAGSEELMGVMPCNMLYVTSDKGYELVSRMKLGKKRTPSEEDVDAFILGALRLEIDQMMDRLAASLEVAAWDDAEDEHGVGNGEFNRRAACLWLGIKEDVAPLMQIPFIRRLAAESIKMIRRNQEMGFTSQEEADAAQMAMDALGDGDFDVFDDEIPF